MRFSIKVECFRMKMCERQFYGSSTEISFYLIELELEHGDENNFYDRAYTPALNNKATVPNLCQYGCANVLFNRYL